MTPSARGGATTMIPQGLSTAINSSRRDDAPTTNSRFASSRLVLLTSDIYPGWRQGLNIVGWLPLLLGLASGASAIVLGSLSHMITDVEQNTRSVLAATDATRKSSEAAVKNSETLMKHTETVMRNTEMAVRNSESALKAAPLAAHSSASSAVSTVATSAATVAQNAANTAVAAASDATQAAASVVGDTANAAKNARAGVTSTLPKLGG